jgi:hypothetical protein
MSLEKEILGVEARWVMDPVMAGDFLEVLTSTSNWLP